MKNNVYNTTDPETLLHLKRQEADTLRDVIRSFNDSSLRQDQIFKIVKNVLMAQLGVKKMMFLYRDEEEMRVGFYRGFKEIGGDALAELPGDSRVTGIEAATYPALHAMGAEFVVPLVYYSHVSAWLLIANFADSEAERINDLIFIETIGNVLTAALENRRLVEELVQRESLRKELQVAEKIQQQLLVRDFSAIKPASIAAMNDAHHGVGGDFYDVIPRSEQGFFLCIADVAGKGIGAALLMANLQANLRALILSENHLVDVIEKLHAILLETTKGEHFVTVFLAHVRYTDGEIDYINAGHNPPMLYRRGEVTQLKSGTIPLGIISLPEVMQDTVTYSPGDTLLMYTDGLPEQHNPEGEMFGEERIEALLKARSDSTPEELIDLLRKEREEFAEDAANTDDITLLAVKFSGDS